MQKTALRQITVRRTRRLKAGHPWIFANELAKSPKGHEPGSLVELEDGQGQFLGIGYINPHSLIAVRLLCREQRPIDRAFFVERIGAALAFRQRYAPGRQAQRLVYGEADGLPGLIVDRYGACVVVQLLTAGMEALRELVLEVLKELCAPAALVLRNDSSFRELEGLERHTELLFGEIPEPLLIDEDGLQLEVDPLGGQKTGLFLDQVDNRQRFAELVRGGRGLDLFCYSATWALRLARRGAQVTCVDSSQPALELAARNAERNGLSGQLSFAHQGVSTFLQDQQAADQRFDFAVVDPPAFVKSKQKIKEALRAYRKLNAAAFGAVLPGGLVATSSCSHHVDRERFVEILRQAAADAGRELCLLELRGAAVDHPVLLQVPETEYLKCAIVSLR